MSPPRRSHGAPRGRSGAGATHHTSRTGRGFHVVPTAPREDPEPSWDYLLHVPGRPVPQGSKRVRITKRGVPVMWDQAGDRLRVWRDAVTLVARSKRRGRKPIEGPVHVRLEFFIAKGQVVDIDKLTRAVLDALDDADLYRDDSQVVRLEVEKAHGDAVGVLICLRALVARL